MERHGAPHQKQLSNDAQKTRNEISSRIFHRHQGEGLAYSVMASSDDIAAQGNSAWAGVDMQASWLAKLGSWSDALTMYERRLEESQDDIEAVLGCMKCEGARGEWKRVLELWDAFSDEEASVRNRRKASRFCAQAAYRLGRWDDLEMHSAQLIESRNDQYQSNTVVGAPRVDFDGAYFSAILNIHRKEWTTAAAYIDGARRAMDSRFTALMAESHKRAYSSMVTAQTLAEMEEIITYRKLEERAKAGLHRHPANKDDEVESRRQLVSLWRKRLAGCRVDAEVHSSIMAVRSLVLGPTDEVEATLTLSVLSRQAQSYKLSERVLLEPLEELGVSLDSPIFGYNIPSGLGLGLLTSYSPQHSNSAGSLINQIMTGEVRNFFPPYGSLHDQYTNNLIIEAGGLER
jgi:FKBP12-rapamycin complex-associated protein